MYNSSTQRYNVMYHYINDSTVYFAEGVLSTVHNYDLSYRKLVEWMGGAYIILIIQSLFVKVVFSMARPHPLEVGNVITHLFDTLNLLLQKIALQKIGHL